MPRSKNSVHIDKAVVLDKARRLFWEKGYRETSMKELAHACSCEPGNIYNYFPSKEAILYELIREEADLLNSSLRHLEEDPDGNPVEQLKEFIGAHLKLAIGERRAAKLLPEAELRSLSPARRRVIQSLRDDYDRILQKILGRGMESGVFYRTDGKIVGYCIASTIIRTRLWFRARGRLSGDEIREIITQFVLRGIVKQG